MSNAVFESVGQALYVSYALEKLPVSCKCSTQIVLDRLRQRLWPDSGGKPNSVNFEGLNPLEVRGQAAMVRSMVERELEGMLLYAIWARYGWYETKEQGLMGLTFELRGIEGLTEESLAWQDKIGFALVCHYFNIGGYTKRGKPQPAPSFREMERYFGIPASTLHRMQKGIIMRIRRAEGQAYGKLSEKFIGGVVKIERSI